MKRLLALVLVCLLCATSALAAEWAEGLGPDQPLPGVPKIDLSKEMGYDYTYPSAKLKVKYFCNVLEIYLPREDIELGEGHAHLYDSTDTEIADIDFANPDQVELRVQQENELVAKKWGSGVCIEMHLPVSLKFNESYYVLMDLNCFTAGENHVSNYDLTEKTQWTPVLESDFGIEGLFYFTPPAPPEEEESEAVEEAPEEAVEANPFERSMVTEETEAAPVEEELGEPKYNPVTGDKIHFDLVLGGDAKTAVIFSENDSVLVSQQDYTESSPVTLTITKDDLDWGVVFLNDKDEVIQAIKPNWVG
ncbi:MAG: hypothetical protein IJI59_17415 [Clostridia bacterium]|nr:hypothetical protein [Clostridia bacterium]